MTALRLVTSGQVVRRCTECGCTDGLACRGGCSWVGPALCSACEPAVEAAALAASRSRHPAGRALRVVRPPLPPHLDPRATPPSTVRRRAALTLLVVVSALVLAFATRGQVATWDGYVPDGVIGVPA